MPNNKNQRVEGLTNSINCARWLVRQFEDLDCPSIARIFQRAVDDADTWIQTMAIGGAIPEEAAQPIKVREATIIHQILIKYASIDDPEIRKQILNGMITALDKQKQERHTESVLYANQS